MGRATAGTKRPIHGGIGLIADTMQHIALRQKPGRCPDGETEARDWLIVGLFMESARWSAARGDRTCPA
jgi:hypothetical protein